MKEVIHFEPLTPSRFDTYSNVGTKAYRQHYLHLWIKQDATPYLESSFTNAVLRKEDVDKNTALFIINCDEKAVGILKYTIDCQLTPYSEKEALCVDKIYILNEYSGKGIGKKVLQFVLAKAVKYAKKVIWLDTMKNGPALHFYLKNGFEKHSERPLHFNTVLNEERPMLVMTKNVPAQESPV